MITFLKKISFFIIGFVILLIVKTSFTPPFSGNELLKAKFRDYYATSEDYNTVFFGSSRIYRHFNPQLFDSLLFNHEVKSYNLGVPAVFNPEIYHIVVNFLENYNENEGNLDYLYVELLYLNDLSLDNAVTSRGSYWNDLKTLNFAFNYITESSRGLTYKLKIYSTYTISHVYRYLDFNYLKPENTTINLNFDLMTNGFLPLDKEIKLRENQVLIERNQEFKNDNVSFIENTLIASSESISKYEKGNIIREHLSILNELLDLSSEKNIELFFVISPQTSEHYFRDIIPLLTEMNQSSFFFYSNKDTYSELYDPQNYFDVGHLNENGANLFTKLFAEDFKSYLEN